MNWKLAILAFTIVTQISTAHADPKSFLYQRMLRLQAEGLEKVSSKVPAQQMNQLIDHFAAKNTAMSGKTFKQNFYVDTSFAKSKSAPVVLYLCGEGPCEGPSGTALVNSFASKYGAYRVALEHRYYGTSQPFSDLSSQHMVYLSMDQALEDLATFENMLKAKLGLTGKWIVVGGSYAGELAAYYREKHPDLVAGALASSGPVLAKADFFEYDRHVAKVVTPECLASIKAVVSDVENKLHDASQTAKAKALFGASEVVDNVDFLYVIADMAAMAVQYGSQVPFCQAITQANDSNRTAVYGAFGQKLFKNFGITSLQDSFQGAMDTSISPGASVGMRGWMYQSCTEFGYYQIANSNVAESSRSQQITQSYHNEACNRLFGINTPVNTAATNSKYFTHLSDKSVTNIFFTNGQNDPWSNLSLDSASTTTQNNPALRFFTIAGGSHCSDLGSAISSALTSARTQFLTLAGDWLSQK